MADVIDKAVARPRAPAADDLVVPFRTGFVRLRAGESARIVKAVRRRFRRHNAGRRYVESEVFAALAASWRGTPVATPAEVRQELWGVSEVRAALERMWPVLTPAQLLHDLFGSPALLRLAGRRRRSTDDELDALFRPRSDDVADVRWTPTDVALLDDAREVLGPVPGKGGKIDEADEIRTYGHIVIDEVQDLTPMQLRMVARRSLNGSLTVVGDLAQATGPWAPSEWDDVLAHLPDKRAGASSGCRSATASRRRSWRRRPGDARGDARSASAAGGARRRRRATGRDRAVTGGARRRRGERHAEHAR